jgi:hypothetical protein
MRATNASSRPPESLSTATPTARAASAQPGKLSKTSPTPAASLFHDESRRLTYQGHLEKSPYAGRQAQANYRHNMSLTWNSHGRSAIFEVTPNRSPGFLPACWQCLNLCLAGWTSHRSLLKNLLSIGSLDAEPEKRHYFSCLNTPHLFFKPQN